ARVALPTLAGGRDLALDRPLDRRREVVGALARRTQREADDEPAHEVGRLEDVVVGQLRSVALRREVVAALRGLDWPGGDLGPTDLGRRLELGQLELALELDAPVLD